MNQEDAHGLTPLNWAAKQGNVAMADKLVDAGATINADPEDGAPPLLDACFRGHLDVAKLLVARGGDATVSEGILGHTCLHKAVDGRNPDVVTWLLEDVGLDVNVADLRGYTPLALAAAKVRCVPLLIELPWCVLLKKPHGGLVSPIIRMVQVIHRSTSSTSMA